jgi:hypothetical protein
MGVHCLPARSISDTRRIVLPEKFLRATPDIVPLSSFANPASCSAVEIVNSVLFGSYHDVSATSIQLPVVGGGDVGSGGGVGIGIGVGSGSGVGAGSGDGSGVGDGVGSGDGVGVGSGKGAGSGDGVGLGDGDGAYSPSSNSSPPPPPPHPPDMKANSSRANTNHDNQLFLLTSNHSFLVYVYSGAEVRSRNLEKIRY